MLAVGLSLPVRANQPGFTGVSFFPESEIAVLRFLGAESGEGFELMASIDRGEHWSPATGIWVDVHRGEIEVSFETFAAAPLLLGLIWNDLVYPIWLFIDEEGQPQFFREQPAEATVEFFGGRADEFEEDEPESDPEPEPEEPSDSGAAVRPDHILYEDENSIVFGSEYLLGLIQDGGSLEVILLDTRLTFPPEVLRALSLREDDRLMVEVRRPAGDIFTVRLVLNGQSIDRTFPHAFTVDLPWSGDNPRVTDADGNFLNFSQRDGRVSALVNSPGSFVLSEMPEASPEIDLEEVDLEEVGRAIFWPVVAAAVFLFLAAVLIILRRRRMRYLRRRQIQKRRQG